VCWNHWKIPLAQKCYLCSRYILLPMSPGWTDLRDYWRSPQFPNHWIAAVSGLKFFRETSFALSFSCLLIAGGKTRSATRLLARRLVFSNAEP
jgi:hypothetical protein